MNLEQVSKGRENNLDLIRFVAAIFVIYCHAFPLTQGYGIPDPLSALTDDQISFGSLAVGIFFVYGGFLICKSMCRLKTAKAYFKARTFRIFPPLIMVTLVLAFIVGPIVTNMDIVSYFKCSTTYLYLLNGLLIGILLSMQNLPGVFENNIYGKAVNGPLWTLPIEFICYIMCFLAYKFKFLCKKNMIWLTLIFAAGCLYLDYMSESIPMLAPMIRPMGLFYAGMMYYVYRDKIKMKFSLCIVSLIAMAVSVVFGVFNITVFLFFPYFFMYIGFAAHNKFPDFAKYGEISYGMYLCAWPVQQILVEKFENNMSPFTNFIITVIISIILGFILYRFVEKPVVKWMKKEKNK